MLVGIVQTMAVSAPPPMPAEDWPRDTTRLIVVGAPATSYQEFVAQYKR